MDEALGLVDYLPDSYDTLAEQEYISFLWAVFDENYGGEKYHFAFLAYHLLVMSFVYFKIWQIKQVYPADFNKALIGFIRHENSLLRADSPFSFSVENERTILRFLRLIACDNSQIGNYRRLVDDRNNAAHANGNVYFKTRHEADIRIRQALQSVEEIHTHSVPMIRLCYRNFLLQEDNPDPRRYPTGAKDWIYKSLIHRNYMSPNDIEICVNFDLSSLGADDMDAIEALHGILCEIHDENL